MCNAKPSYSSVHFQLMLPKSTCFSWFLYHFFSSFWDETAEQILNILISTESGIKYLHLVTWSASLLFTFVASLLCKRKRKTKVDVLSKMGLQTLREGCMTEQEHHFCLITCTPIW